MSASLLHITGPIPGQGERIVIDGSEGRHGASALRLAPGEDVLVGDGAGVLAECRVESAGQGTVEATVLARREVPEPSLRVTVVQALPKSERSELAVDLATEAGADEIVPWQSERCVSRWTGGKGSSNGSGKNSGKAEKGRAKWENAARAAAKQARRARVPRIGELVEGRTLAALVREWTDEGALVVVLHEEESRPFADAIGSAVAGAEAATPGRLVLVVGPEGGVSPAEIEALRSAGAVPALLGPEVLRTSTAAAVALGAIGVLTGRWGG
ncbi:16S rRNA (uracil(1498)-N(3))-methyltransferase [Dietzia sp.]|uniref:16S rRNA (uracil(1498)-N(3))-methyltransferase n=1 Tax=Dietzia sp. TaxID=1871616 RepID=UPI002FDAB6DB